MRVVGLDWAVNPADRAAVVLEQKEHERFFESPEEIASLPELASVIRSLDRLDWMWISAEFGVLLNQPEVDASTILCVDSSGLWNNVFVPLVDWFR